MRKKKIGNGWILSLLSVVSVGTYLGVFSFSSKVTANEMALPGTKGEQANAQLSQLQVTYQSLLQKETQDESDLQSMTNQYSRAYQVAQHDDQVLAAISQQLQSQGMNPINVPNTPAPLSGVNVNSSPPIVQSTTSAS